MFEMDDMPYKPGKSPAELEEGAHREWQAELKKREASAKRKATRAANSSRPKTARKQTATTGKRPVKKLPPMIAQGEQPRDRLGRFARKTGAVLWGAAKGTVKAVKGTAKAVKSAHKTVKRVQASGRRRASLEARERRIALAEREKKLGLRKKVNRRRKR